VTVEIGFVCFPYSVRDIVSVARAADSAKERLLFGVADSPRLFAESYVAQQAVLGATRHVDVGPFSTNPVTRHWGVHAGLHRSLDELHPGRTFMGLAAGDSAVHAFGLKPANGDAIAVHAAAVREHGPADLRIVIATGGLKSAAKAGIAADEVVVGQGFDAGATEALTEAVLAGRREAGVDRPLKRWLYVLADIWEDGDGSDDPAERVLFQSMLMSYSRQAMSATYRGKNVPEHMQPRLKELYSKFSFEQYGDSYNAKLLEEFAEEKEFLRKRFTVAGTPEQVAAQLRDGAAATGVDAIWVGLLTRNAEPMMQLFADRTLPRLAEPVVELQGEKQ